MKVKDNTDRFVTVELSRRNVENLIAALDRGEYALLTRHDHSANVLLRVRVVEDAQHYGEREPGPMPLDEEVSL